MDRAVRSVERFPRVEGPVDKWRALRQEIHDEVCAKGWNADVGAFTQYYGGHELDASVLMMPLVGFLPASDPRVSGTMDAISRQLVVDGLVLRYRADSASHVDGLTGGEGAFLPCSFWLAENLALSGREDEGRALFERLLDLANDLGLLAEEYDTKARRQVGNFPQAFSHMSLVSAAQCLSGVHSRDSVRAK
jgi:GH15 family glucan-1,4-alpha-glucosidase